MGGWYGDDWVFEITNGKDITVTHHTRDTATGEIQNLNPQMYISNDEGFVNHPDDRTYTFTYVKAEKKIYWDSMTSGNTWTKHYDSPDACGPDTCAIKDVIMPDGTCRNCGNMFRPDSIAMPRNCIQDSCNDREIYDVDGYCQSCNNYERAQSSNTVCAADSRNPN